jgi:hypothetical protein
MGRETLTRGARARKLDIMSISVLAIEASQTPPVSWPEQARLALKQALAAANHGSESPRFI